MSDHIPDAFSLDLDQTAHSAILQGHDAVQKIAGILNDAFQLVNIIEGHIDNPHIKRGAESIVARMRDAVLEMAEATQDNAALIAALTTGLKSTVAQRDQAIDGRLTVENEWLEAISEANGFTRDETEKLLTLLLNDDTELLEADVVLDHTYLSEIREAFQALILDIDEVIE